MWKVFLHTFAFSWVALTVAFDTNCSSLKRPSLIWFDYNLNNDMPTNIWLLYLVQIGCYMFGAFTLVFCEERRKDYTVMMVHHGVTLSLLIISYTLRCHKLGMLVMMLHDVTDIFLDLGKMFQYMKVNNQGEVNKIMDISAYTCFVGLLVSWVVCRLYWYPLKVLFWGLRAPRDVVDIWVVAIGNLAFVTLFFMNIYWFGFMLKLAYQLFVGDLKDLKDTSAYDREELEKRKQMKIQ
jgi:ceramide synthetase